MKLPICLAFAACLLAGAAPYSVQLDAARCRPSPPGRLAELGPDWVAMAPYVQNCPVQGPDGRLALSVDIIRLDRAYAVDHFAAHPNQAVPTPIMRDAAGTAIGDLGEGFPIDPPGKLRVRFTDWRGGFPHEIRLYQAGESALAPHALPSMRWDPGTRRYR